MHADDLIHRKRNAGGSFTVGDPNDMTPISDIFATDENLYVITSKAIYLVQLADNIDPARTNPNLPNSQKKVLNHGSENEIIGRVLLTAKILFDRNHLGPNFSYHAALSNAFELTKLLTEMQDIHAELASVIDPIIQQGLITGEDGSLRLPTTSKLETRVETFIKKQIKFAVSSLNILSWYITMELIKRSSRIYILTLWLNMAQNQVWPSLSKT